MNAIKRVAANFVASDSFMSRAYFYDGGYAVWQGRPRGLEYDRFQAICK